MLDRTDIGYNREKERDKEKKILIFLVNYSKVLPIIDLKKLSFARNPPLPVFHRLERKRTRGFRDESITQTKK